MGTRRTALSVRSAPRDRAGSKRSLHRTQHEAVLELQRMAGNQAVADLMSASLGNRSALNQRAVNSPVVQRAIMAIDGSSDNAEAKAVTRECLTTLKTRKQVLEPSGKKAPKFFSAGDARGAVFGPASAASVEKSLWSGVAARQVARDESLYILGHGGNGMVADMAPNVMAAALNKGFRRMPADRSPWTGSIKLVACYGASMKMDDAPITDAVTFTPITKPFAESLAAALHGGTGRVQPTEVVGVAGVSWVDEASGRLVGFDVSGETLLNPVDYIYASSHATDWMKALQMKNGKARKAEMERIIELARDELEKAGQPAHKGLPSRMVGKAAKKKYAV